MIIPTLLPAKKRGPRRRLDHDSAYLNGLIELWPTRTAKEIALILGTTDRTVERDIAELRRRQKIGTPGPTAKGSLSDLSTGVNQQIPNNDTTPSPDAGGTGEPDGGK
ncbi:MAG: hypothetical protein K1X67_07895 [Fimbriimonadaceae bacterium]|nr:hypothetical protein [Fimbriimonadaceae bacterium]